MIDSRLLHRAATLAAFLVAGSAPPPAAQEIRASDPARLPYLEFAASGRAAILLSIARRAYLDSAGIQDSSPVDSQGAGDRPAGPRDEPPPPDWPAGPAGLVVCLKVRGEARACEGELRPSIEDLSAAISNLAARLPASRSRGKLRPLKPARQREESIEAAFIVGAAAPPEGIGGREKAVRLPDGVQPELVGFVVSGSGGEIVTLPGEVRSVKAALKLARKAGLTPGSGRDLEARWYRSEVIGSAPVVSP